jgi:hypothetical protein
MWGLRTVSGTKLLLALDLPESTANTLATKLPRANLTLIKPGKCLLEGLNTVLASRANISGHTDNIVENKQHQRWGGLKVS